MTKYIFKESELSSVLNNIITEEINSAVNEGIFKALGNAALNTAAFGAKALLSPLTAGGDVIKKMGNIVNGPDTIAGTVSDFFGGPATGSSSSSSSGGSKRQTRSQKQSERYRAGRDVSFEYGRPETVPGWGNRLKLAKKELIFAPPPTSGTGTTTAVTINWDGDFGRHYRGEGDDIRWRQVVANKEKAIIRNSTVRGTVNPNRVARLTRRYKRMLIGWLKDRDEAYEAYIKTHNKI